MASKILSWMRPVVIGAWLAGGMGLAVATAEEVRTLWLLPETPPEVVRDITVRHVADASGHEASFRILLFSDEFRWRLSSWNTIEDGTSVPRFTPEMKTVLDSAVEIICVGASSEEVPAGIGTVAGRQHEEWRAGRRAERIAVWVREALSKPIPVRKLNIGHHAPTSGTHDTSDQRRVVVILVLDRDEDANLDEALRAAMTREASRTPLFASLLGNYSLGGGQAFTWMP